MGTIVTIEVVHDAAEQRSSHLEAAVTRAFAWFQQIEERCTRFDQQSELAQLSAHVGVPIQVSAILFEAVQFALAVAEETNGAFDPTVGGAMEENGFDRNYSSGQKVKIAPASGSGRAATNRPTYRDVHLDANNKTITLRRPLLLDLGAVAKGLAIDMAAHELRPFENFVINAGGDVYVAGHNAKGEPWSVGIRHPRHPEALCDSLKVSNAAVCTSGDYERPRPAQAATAAAEAAEAVAAAEAKPSAHHILDPRSGASAQAAASVTVIAPTAMLADALATAAFVLGPVEGIALLERLNVDGLFITPTLERHATRQAKTPATRDESEHDPSGTTILPDAQGPSPDRPDRNGRPSRAL
jgi:thiamine biosynthesis lipoprotein